MKLQELFTNVTDSILLSNIQRTDTTELSNKIEPLILECIAISKNESKDNTEALKSLVMDVFDVLAQATITELESSYGPGDTELITKHLTKVFKQGQSDQSYNQELTLEAWFQSLTQNLSITRTDSMIHSLGAICSYMRFSANEICKRYLAKKLLNEYRKEHSNILLDENHISSATGKPASSSFYEIINILLIDDPYSSFEAIKEAAFLIMDSLLELDMAQQQVAS